MMECACLLSMPPPTSLSAAAARDDPSKDMGCCHLGVGFDQLLLSLCPITMATLHMLARSTFSIQAPSRSLTKSFSALSSFSSNSSRRVLTRPSPASLNSQHEPTRKQHTCAHHTLHRLRSCQSKCKSVNANPTSASTRVYQILDH